MPPDEPTDDERQEQLSQDGQTPFSPPDPARDPDADADDERQIEETTDDTHPDTDDGIDSDEYYQNGLGSSSGASEPNAGNAVTGYTPPSADDDIPDNKTDERGVS